MKLFGYVIVKKEELEEIHDMALKYNNLATYWHWFHHWTDLRLVLRGFVNEELNGNTVMEIRKQVAKLRQTDEWGFPTPLSVGESRIVEKNEEFVKRITAAIEYTLRGAGYTEERVQFLMTCIWAKADKLKETVRVERPKI
jgi:hypothetical protein